MSASDAIKSTAHRSLPEGERDRLRHSLDDYPLRTTEKLRFADTDCNGHISNAVFAVCCQNARMEVLHDPRRVPLPIDGQFVIARLEIDFLGEMRWPGTVVIGTRCERIGRTSLMMAQALFVDGRCAASARSTVVLMDRTTRRATSLPPETASALQAFCAPLNGNGLLHPYSQEQES
ncbi:thioesterase family protein [Hyphomicrobium sp. CS1BSMeth3]|uniref:acyl-CoA thioesterase n=1 Tax=Hyphomicrobium sp. CS1BSMeth3 TaxID=1892844 RepID=UPI0009F8D906|nr:thioesterase family protein [Hyphomicrobium sp. CS1BSMeth3]